MDDAILVDGEWVEQVPANDRGLAYGDGVYRTLRVEHGQPVAWPVHMQRLAHDCARLGLPRPSEPQLAADAARLFKSMRQGVLKIIITRGSGGRGYMPPRNCSSRRILSAHPFSQPRAEVPRILELNPSPVVLARQPRLAGVKHLNRLEQVLARDECARANAADAYMCDSAGWVISTTMRNLMFLDRKGHWLTPALGQAGIIGATRQRLMGALAEAGTPVREAEIAVGALVGMRAAIACNSVSEVMAVTRMGETLFPESETALELCRNLLIED